jgi:hypothetical protein
MPPTIQHEALTSVNQPFDDEPENEITLTAFRLLTMDLLVLFHVLNEATINILGEHSLSAACCSANRIHRELLRVVETRCDTRTGRIPYLRKADRGSRPIFELSAVSRAFYKTGDTKDQTCAD